MDIVNLVDFVKAGELFDKVDWIFDQVVSDFDFWDLENFIKINTILDFDKIDKSKSTLFVLDNLLPENVSDFFDMKNFCILDLNFGIYGYGHKNGISKIDLWYILNNWIDIYEPFDLLSLLHNIEKTWNKYIRIDSKNLPWWFSDESENNIVFMDKHGLSWDAFCIVTTGSMLPEIVRTVNILNDDGLFVDVFVLNKLNFDLDKKIKEKLSNTKNLVFISDLFNSDNYEKWIKTKIKGVNLKFVYPKYENLSTVLNEYKAEETKFDALWLVERLK